MPEARSKWVPVAAMVCIAAMASGIAALGHDRGPLFWVWAVSIILLQIAIFARAIREAFIDPRMKK